VLPQFAREPLCAQRVKMPRAVRMLAAKRVNVDAMLLLLIRYASSRRAQSARF